MADRETKERVESISRIISSYMPSVKETVNFEGMTERELSHLFAKLSNCADYIWTLKTLKYPKG